MQGCVQVYAITGFSSSSQIRKALKKSQQPDKKQQEFIAINKNTVSSPRKVCLVKRKVYIFIKFAKIMEGKRKPRDKPPEYDIKMQILLPFSTVSLEFCIMYSITCTFINKAHKMPPL
uniref:Uncharacterized protein n=1 Tax=Micrurus lemniscatus lemniscatus TaxID=129467 RepID=A0A2D4IAI5_MICLE